MSASTSSWNSVPSTEALVSTLGTSPPSPWTRLQTRSRRLAGSPSVPASRPVAEELGCVERVAGRVPMERTCDPRHLGLVGRALIALVASSASS